MRPQNTKGSAENMPLLEAGKLDIGLVQGEAALEALNGIGRPPADLRILAAMYATPGMFVVRADSPYRTIEDLKGKPVAFGAKGSGLVLLARYVLDGLGLDRDRDFEAIFLDRAGDGPAMVMDGRAAALWGGGTGWPGFTAVAKGRRAPASSCRTRTGIARIRAKQRSCKTLTVPANSFPGQTRGRRRSARGASSWRGRRCPTTWPTGWRARCTRARPRSPSACRRRARPPPPTRPPPRGASCCIRACCSTCARSGW